MNTMRPDLKNSINPMRHRGSAVVEFALLLILLLTIVAGIIEFGRIFWYYDALTKATRDSARFLSNTRLSTTVAIDSSLIADAKTIVNDAATLAQVPNFSSAYVVVACDTPCDASPSYVNVSVNAYTITIGSWIPFFAPNGTLTAWSVNLSPSTSMRYMR